VTSPRAALVTGAAGGIGREIAAALHADGWTVATTDLPGKVDPRGTDLSVAADLRDRDECHRLLNVVLSEFGRLDLLVNNAATMTVVEPAVDTMNLWWQDVDVNLKRTVVANSVCGRVPTRSSRSGDQHHQHLGAAGGGRF